MAGGDRDLNVLTSQAVAISRQEKSAGCAGENQYERDLTAARVIFLYY